MKARRDLEVDDFDEVVGCEYGFVAEEKGRS